MPYLVDSDVLIDLLADRPATLELLTRLAPEGLAMSLITYLEVYEGTLRTPQPQEAQARLRTLLMEIPVLPLSLSLAERCAHLRDRLRRAGKRVRSRAFDVLVAATALEHNLTLVTRNTEDYEDIPELKLYTP